MPLTYDTDGPPTKQALGTADSVVQIWEAWKTDIAGTGVEILRNLKIRGQKDYSRPILCTSKCKRNKISLYFPLDFFFFNHFNF